MKGQGRRPRRPYLLRAMVAWISDNGETPHIVVDASQEGVQVPSQYVTDGKVVLNIGGSATQALNISNDAVEFSARFGGVPFPVYVPVRAVLGIYARESGEGMIFTDTEGDPPPGNDGGDDDTPGPKGPPKLSVVK
ncbi:MAG: ClpXP protease specificity-enhancing factor [Gammaproteobacteria bacterium]